MRHDPRMILLRPRRNNLPRSWILSGRIAPGTTTDIYDVWGRLVELKSATGLGQTLAKFEYNGLFHRTLAHYDTDTDGDVDSNDTKLWLAYNERWQLVASFENTTSTPKEEWVFHNAGASGFGDSSYIDAVILRDRNAETSDPNLEERRYFCQNWRHDVVALVTDTGKMIEWVKYASYGVAMASPAGDTNSDFAWNSTDDAAIQLAAGIGGTYTLRGDANLNGTNESADITHANSITGGYQTLGWNVLSSTGVLNYRGYAGYEWDRSAPELYHVRFRALNNKLGRWITRDALTYIDGMTLVAYSKGSPLTFVDSSGSVPIPVIAIGIIIVVGSAIIAVEGASCCRVCGPWSRLPWWRIEGDCGVLRLDCIGKANSCRCKRRKCVTYIRSCGFSANQVLKCQTSLTTCEVWRDCQYRAYPPPGVSCQAACAATPPPAWAGCSPPGPHGWNPPIKPDCTGITGIFF